MGSPDQRGPTRTTHVHYAEARGEGATETLRALLAELPGQPGFLGAELLLSPPQPGLALLASRWSQEPALTLPPGVRAWAFVVVDAVERQPRITTRAGSPPLPPAGRGP